MICLLLKTLSSLLTKNGNMIAGGNYREQATPIDMNGPAQQRQVKL